MMTKMFVATKAFIVKDGKVLVVREATEYDVGTNAGKYDVVGGRIEPGEHYEDALRREVREEVGLDVEIIKPFAVGEWFPSVKGEQWHVVAVYFECRPISDTLILSADHNDAAWVDVHDYKKYSLVSGLEQIFEKFLTK